MLGELGPERHVQVLLVPHSGVVAEQLWSVSLTCILLLVEHRHTQEGWEMFTLWCGRTREGQGMVLKDRSHYLGIKTADFKSPFRWLEKEKAGLGAHTFNPSAWEAEAGESL